MEGCQRGKICYPVSSYIRILFCSVINWSAKSISFISDKAVITEQKKKTKKRRQKKETKITCGDTLEND